MKIISWNINGLQGILKKSRDKTIYKSAQRENLLDLVIEKEDPDFLCLQEIRCSNKFDHSKFLFPSTYLNYVNYSKVRKGYSGTMICCKEKPINVTYDFKFKKFNNDEEYNSEGRVITLEYKDFYLINVYTPNSGTDQSRLKYRVEEWDKLTIEYIKILKQDKKDIILVGDLNCVPTDLDCYKKLSNIFAGNTKEEKESFQNILKETEMIDTFRTLHPELNKSSWHGPYSKHGCRLDFCLISKNLSNQLQESDILNNYIGSDHYPIVVIIKNFSEASPFISQSSIGEILDEDEFYI
jgi:exodeoxyribonuclease-3